MIMRKNRGRIDKNNNNNNNADDNNNSTSSDKTLDSGIFDLCLTSYTNDIIGLSAQYDSKEFLDQDAMSLKSGYSSASDSLAESITDSLTTLNDSNDEHPNSEVTLTLFFITFHENS